MEERLSLHVIRTPAPLLHVLAGENGQAIPDFASWMAMCVLLIYIAVALGYGVVIVREEMQDQIKTNKIPHHVREYRCLSLGSLT